nr:hypothetical protein [Tanacetum cinerariifolium]
MVMICRMWDVHAATSRYLSIDFIETDTKGNVMHCTVKANIAHNFLRLKEGSIYSVKNLTVVPNKDEFCVIRLADFMLEFDGKTTVRKSFLQADGFTRYPFQLVEIDELEPTNNKYLIGKTIVMFDDETAEVVVVMFDETKRVLLKCSASSILDYEGQIYFSAPFHFMNMFTDLRMHDEEAYLGLPIALANIVGISHTLELKSHMYYEHGNYESFTCWKVVKGEDVEEGASSATVAANDASKASKLKRLSKPLAVATPSKLGEEKKQRREDLEDSDAKASFVADSQPKGEDVAYSSNKRKIKRSAKTTLALPMA